MPTKHRETASSWQSRNSEGRSIDNWYDFDRRQTPQRASKKEKLARLLQSFDCSEHTDGCANLRCLEREKADELKEIESDSPTKSQLNKDFEVGAHLLDLNRGRIFGDTVTAARIKKKVYEMPLVAALPLIKQLHDRISELPESRESKLVENTFNMLTQALGFLALDDSDAPQVMSLLDKVYREADFKRTSITKTWRTIDRKLPHEVFVRSTYKPSEPTPDPSPPAHQTQKSSSTPQRRYRKTTGKFASKYPLKSVWDKKKAIYKKWQSKNYSDYLICAKFNNAGCPKREQHCDRVHECVGCEKMGHGEGICPDKL